MNFFIKHLAIADLFVGLISVLTDIIWKITISWNAGWLACKMIRFLQASVTYASTYVLVALSIDRYVAFIVSFRVSRGRYDPILSPSLRVVEQQLLIPGLLPEFLETSGIKKICRFLEKVAISRI